MRIAKITNLANKYYKLSFAVNNSILKSIENVDVKNANRYANLAKSQYYIAGLNNSIEKIFNNYAPKIYYWLSIINSDKINIKDCHFMTNLWYQIFIKEGLNPKIIEGFYWVDFDPNISPPGLSDHFWLEINEECLFDPTAIQYGSNINFNNYYVFDENSKHKNFLEKYVK